MIALLVWLIACPPPLTEPTTVDNPNHDFDGDMYTEAEEEGDCDDADPTVTPVTPVYADADGDGFGDGDAAAFACDADVLADPDAWVRDTTDCDDANARAYPGADEGCVDEDLDCDGLEGTADGDGDGFPGCEECDDRDNDVNPDAPELCNGVDDDCNEAIDELAIDATAWFRDTDGDAYGDVAAKTTACEAPPDYVANSEDCDDADESAHPGAGEVCNERDDDCDDIVDENATDADEWYADADGDSYGAGAMIRACEQPAATATTSDDCDDGAAAVHPNAVETCDGVDQDCDDVVDNDPSDGKTWYRDADKDGFGKLTDTTIACTQPAGYVANSTDCDDTRGSVYPGAAEINPVVDEDCDGDLVF